MTITFICGTLEPSQDGVGDYTRRLAGEQVRLGHEVSVVALYDAFTISIWEGFQKDSQTFIRVLRISANLPERKRFASLRLWLDDFQPTWISLQFVPFSFHPKGLPFRLGARLIELGKEVRWHIMFHELWVGMESKVPGKLWWWGKLQGYIIKNLISELKPLSVHTQTKLYMAQLAKLGCKSAYLPLFGNIPVVRSLAKDVQLSVDACNKVLTLILFGTIHQCVPVESLANEVKDYAMRNNVRVELKVVGRSGAELKHWVAIWQACGIPVEQLGEQPPEYVSEILQSASLGISTTPTALIEKSGAVAAMREHGLPVLCVRQPWEVSWIDDDTPLSGIMQYQVGNFEDCIGILAKAEATPTLQGVGLKMLEDLLSVN